MAALAIGFGAFAQEDQTTGKILKIDQARERLHLSDRGAGGRGLDRHQNAKAVAQSRPLKAQKDQELGNFCFQPTQRSHTPQNSAVLALGTAFGALTHLPFTLITFS